MESKSEDANRYRLHTYFPRSRQIDNDRMYSAPYAGNKKAENLLKHGKLTLCLLSLTCEELHILAGKYYNSKNFSLGNELFSTFVELPRKKACLFLASEVARDIDFWNTYPAKIKTGVTHFRITAITEALKELVTIQAEIVASKQNKHCPRTTLPNSLNCPRGYKPDLSTVDSSGTGAGLSADPDTACCVKDDKASKRRPLVWNEKIETKVLHSIRTALLDTIQLIVARKVFENSHGREFEMKDCDDEDILAPEALAKVAKDEVKSKIKAFGENVKRLLRHTYDNIKEFGSEVKKYLESFPDAKIVLQYSSRFLDLTKGLIKGMYEKFIKSNYEAVLLRNVKKRLLETLCEFVVNSGLLKGFEDNKNGPEEDDENYRQSFSKKMREEWVKIKGKKRSFQKKDVIQKQLWEIFYSKFKDDESLYGEVFSDTIGTCLDILSDLSFGTSNIFLNTASRVSNGIIISAFENVFVNFFYMDIAGESTDVLDYLLTVFDVSQELCRKPLLTRTYPVLLEWRQNIDSQILGSTRQSDRHRKEQQDEVMDQLWKTNQYILGLESEDTRAITQQNKSPLMFSELEAIIKESKLQSLPRKKTPMLMLEDKKRSADKLPRHTSARSEPSKAALLQSTSVPATPKLEEFVTSPQSGMAAPHSHSHNTRLSSAKRSQRTPASALSALKRLSLFSR